LIRPAGWTAPAGALPRSTEATTLFSSLPDFDSASGLDPLAVDSDDPVGLLGSVDPTTFETLDGYPPAGIPTDGNPDYHTRDTYHVPLVVSAGADGLLGLFAPGNTANFGHLAAPNGNTNDVLDNITNLNIRSGVTAGGG
jgi:hypothetical protein